MLDDLEKKINDLIECFQIAEQSELQNLLKKEGYDIPQATLSRRLKKMHIVKVDGFYKKIKSHLSFSVPIISIHVSDFGIVVLKTYPGHANTLAYYIDQKNLEGVLGSLAGDDTVFVTLQSFIYYKNFLDFAKQELGYTLPI